MRGQVAIEYMSYFSIFLIVAIIFTSVAYLYAQSEFHKQSESRYTAIMDRVTTVIEDGNRLSKYIDKMEYTAELPIIATGEEMKIEIKDGIVEGNVGEYKHYYSRVSLDKNVNIEPGENTVKISKG